MGTGEVRMKKDAMKFCANQIEIILRYVQNSVPNTKRRSELETNLSYAVVIFEEYIGDVPEE